jgi:hypothetical protein
MPLFNREIMTYSEHLRTFSWRALTDEALAQDETFNELTFKEKEHACDAVERQKLAVAEQYPRLSLAVRDEDYVRFRDIMQSRAAA